MSSNPFGLSNFRFLDSLDSMRFRDDIDFPNIRMLHAKAEVILCMLFGDGVVVPENQLVDSKGFINLFPELVLLGIKYNVTVPIRVAVRDLKLGLYGSAAKLFETIDQDDVKKRFQLSSYQQELDESYKRRKVWADSISRMELPPQEYVRDHEQKTIIGLMDILKYLNTPGIAEFAVIQSEDMPFILANELSQIAELAEKNDLFEKLFYEQVDPRFPKIILPEWLAEGQRKPAEEIINTLHEFEKRFGTRNIKRRSLIHNNKEDIKTLELQKGVLEVTDALYNFNLAISTHSDNISDTASRNLSNPYIATARSLVNWARETSKVKIGVFTGHSLNNPDGWISTSGFNWNEFLTDKQRDKILYEMPLEACVSLLAEPKWKNSMAAYKYELANLRNIDTIMNGVDDLSDKWQEFRDDAKKRLEDTWHEHVRICGETLADSSWRLSSKGKIEHVSPSDLLEKVEIETEVSVETSKPVFKLKTDLRTIQRAIMFQRQPDPKESHEQRIQGLVADLADAYNPIQ